MEICKVFKDNSLWPLSRRPGDGEIGGKLGTVSNFLQEIAHCPQFPRPSPISVIYFIPKSMTSRNRTLFIAAVACAIAGFFATAPIANAQWLNYKIPGLP